MFVFPSILAWNIAADVREAARQLTAALGGCVVIEENNFLLTNVGVLVRYGEGV